MMSSMHGYGSLGVLGIVVSTNWVELGLKMSYSSWFMILKVIGWPL